MHAAIKDDSALRSNFNGALLLPLRARQVIAVPDELQVAKPPEDRQGPQHRHSRDDQQAFGRYAVTTDAVGSISCT